MLTALCIVVGLAGCVVLLGIFAIGAMDHFDSVAVCIPRGPSSGPRCKCVRCCPPLTLAEIEDSI